MKGDSDSAELLLITRLYARFVEGSCDGPGAEVVAWDGKEVGTTVRPGNGTVDGCGVGYIELILKLLAPLSPHAKTVHRSTATPLAIAITMVLCADRPSDWVGPKLLVSRNQLGPGKTFPHSTSAILSPTLAAELLHELQGSRPTRRWCSLPWRRM